jgi:hypothetical protein
MPHMGGDASDSAFRVGTGACAPHSIAAVPDWDEVVAIGRTLPEVEVGTWFGTPGLKVAGKGFCRLRTKPDALVIRVLDLGDREALLRGQPDVFFTTPHHEAYPYVLVRLDKVYPGELVELIEDAWRIRAPKRLLAAFEADRAVRDEQRGG